MNALVSTGNREFAAPSSLKLRQSAAVSELAERANLVVALCHAVLDRLAAAVFIVGRGGRVLFANAAAEALQADGTRPIFEAGALGEAIASAVNGDAGNGMKAAGVPIPSFYGRPAAAYVLPIAGPDLRQGLNPGYAAVLIGRGPGGQQAAMELLGSLFGFTPMEARVASQVGQGDCPSAIAENLGLSVNTVRSHLVRAYAKSGATHQAALAALVNGLMPPV